MKVNTKFRDWLKLNESPVAVIDDWAGFKVKTDRIGKTGIKKFWVLQDKIVDKYKHNIEIYKSKDSHHYIMGAWAHETHVDRIKEVFTIIVELKITPRKDLESLYINPIQMSKVETMSPFRDKGYAKLLYSWFISSDYTLISDMVQFDGARKIYDSLSRESNITADIIDDQERKIIKRNARIDSGSEDWDFDTDIWSYDFKKANIRIALYKK